MHRKFYYQNKEQSKNHVRLDLCEKIRNTRKKQDPSILIKSVDLSVDILEYNE